MDPVLIFLMAFAAIFVVGIAGEVVFAKTNVPDVVWLMLVGVLLGPVLGVVKREDLMMVGPYFGAITLVIVLPLPSTHQRRTSLMAGMMRYRMVQVKGSRDE